jgi:hypothetical protein
MATERQEGMLPVPLAVVGQGITFSHEWQGDGVEVEIEYPDGSWADWGHVSERSITISREDWDAIVAHVASGAQDPLVCTTCAWTGRDWPDAKAHILDGIGQGVAHIVERRDAA